MARAVVVWSDGERLRLAELPESGRSMIGRAPGSTVDLSDQSKYERYKTVSREHARLIGRNGTFQLEHLSRHNPTKLNNVAVSAPVPLSDRDTIQVGALRLDFHDLAAADRFSGPICNSCGRENIPAAEYCWNDGTALLNADSSRREPRPVLCRVMSASGGSWDLYASETFVTAPDGRGEVRRPERDPDPNSPAAITLRDGKPALLVAGGDSGAQSEGATGSKLLVNGQARSDGMPLATGDEVQVGDDRFLVIVR